MSNTFHHFNVFNVHIAKRLQQTNFNSNLLLFSTYTEPASPFLELGDEIHTTYVDLEWIAPTGYLVAGYKLASDPEEENSNLPIELASDLDEYRVTGLAPGRQYKFHLYAFAIVEGEKIYSDPSEISARTCKSNINQSFPSN